MSTDTKTTIVTRLKALGCLCANGCQGRCLECPDDVIADAINEIERLRAELAKAQAMECNCRV